MVKVTKSLFESVLNKTPHRLTARIGERDTLRYDGKKGLFKDLCFAQRVGDEYYVDSFFVK